MDIKKSINNIWVSLKEVTLSDWMIIVSTILLFAQTFFKLVAYGWPRADYTHSYFIVPISLFLIWLVRGKLTKVAGINLPGSLLFLLGMLTYLFGAINDFMFLEASSFVIIMWALFRLRFTKDSFKHLLFPLTYLFFMIPPPGLVIDMVTMPLKKISAVASFKILSLLQIPVSLRGVILQVKDHELLIADACSGFRSIITLLSLGAIYVYFQDLSLKKRWILFVLIIPLSIFANITRITLTGIFSYSFGHEFAEGFFHEASGIVLFVITVLGLMGAVEIFHRIEHNKSDVKKQK